MSSLPPMPQSMYDAVYGKREEGLTSLFRCQCCGKQAQGKRGDRICKPCEEKSLKDIQGMPPEEKALLGYEDSLDEEEEYCARLELLDQAAREAEAEGEEEQP